MKAKVYRKFLAICLSVMLALSGLLMAVTAANAASDHLATPSEAEKPGTAYDDLLLPEAAEKDKEKDGVISDFAELKMAISSYEGATEDVVIEIGEDIVINELLTIPANGNGKVLTITSADDEIRTLSRGVDGRLFTLSDRSTALVLKNIIIDGNKKEYDNIRNNTLFHITGGKLTMNAGAMLRNNDNIRGSGFNHVDGGGVHISGSNSIFNLNGGTISGNTVTAGSGKDVLNRGYLNLFGTPNLTCCITNADKVKVTGNLTANARIVIEYFSGFMVQGAAIAVDGKDSGVITDAEAICFRGKDSDDKPMFGFTSDGGSRVIGGYLQLEGTVAVSNTSPRYGDKLMAETADLTANPVGADIMGVLSYQWYRDGTAIAGATQSTYTVAKDDIGTAITVKVEAANCLGSQVSVATSTATRADGPAAPAIDMTCEYVSGNVWTVTITPQAGCEYSFDGITYSGADGANVKTGCASGDTVTGYIRKMETDTHNASPAASQELVLPVPATSVTVTGTDGADSITVKGGTLQMLADIRPDGALQTVAWSVSGSGATISSTGLLTATGNGTVTVRATAGDGSGVYGEMTVTITNQTNGSNNNNNNNNNGSGSSGSGGGASSSGATASAAAPADIPAGITVVLTGQPDANGHLTEVITEAMVVDAVSRAAEEAARRGRNQADMSVSFSNGTGGVTGLAVRFDAAAIDRLNTAGTASVAVNTGVFRFRLDRESIRQIDEQTTGVVTVAAKPVTTLSAAATALTGSRPVFDLTITDEAGHSITGMGSGRITFGLYYSPAGTESTGGLYAVSVSADGQPQLLSHSGYADGWVIWSSTPGVYGVGYQAPAVVFRETEGHWAKDDIDFAVSRGLFVRTGDTVLTPDTAITRGMIVTALGRLSGQDMSGYTGNSFTDVGSERHDRPYIEWAAANGIVQGAEDGRFLPDEAVTREEMAVMMYRYAGVTGGTLPVSREAVTFSDRSAIGSDAGNAVKALQQAGVVNGRSADRFEPGSAATCAEASAMLHRFVKLVINEETARGWSRLDNGTRQYYDGQGRRLTGWQTIGGETYCFDSSGVMQAGTWVQTGGKWYYLLADGTLAVNTTIDGYEVGADGAWRSE